MFKRLNELVIKYRFHILFVLFVGTLLAFWPGYMQGDSKVQYGQAISGLYSDHHPPLMSFLWRYLDRIYQGSGLIYALQVFLLYAAIVVFMITLNKLPSKYRRDWMYYVFLIFPVYPQILIYLLTIVKDIQFATCYLLISAILTYYTVVNKKPNILHIAIMFLLLVYGSAVKYQGQFLAIIPAVWLGWLSFKDGGLFKKVFPGILIYALVISSIFSINSILVPVQSKNHSWQYVKLYDLAAISISTKTDLIPKANRTSLYTTEKLYSRFTYPCVDNYVFPSDGHVILRISKNPGDGEFLYNTWQKAVTKHPYYYLKHRAINLAYILLSRPGMQYATPYIDKYPAIGPLVGTMFYLFMSHLPVVILGAGYFVLAAITLRRTEAALAVLATTGTALAMVLILLFMTMNGTPRYTYISILLIHAMHPFAYVCYRSIKEKRKKI